MSITAVHAGNEIMWQSSKSVNVDKVGTIDTYDGTKPNQFKPLLFEADYDKPVTIIWYKNGNRMEFTSPGDFDDGRINFTTSYLIRKKFKDGRMSPDFMIWK